MLVRMWKRQNPCTLLVGLYIGVFTNENSIRFLKKCKIELPYYPAIPLLDIYLKKSKTLIQKDIWSIFTVAKIWKQPKRTAIDNWIKWYIYTMKCYSAKKGIKSYYCNNMDLEGILLNELSHTEKNKYHTISLTCKI